jgi:DNA-binding CsgD family transcriptional regulator
MRHPHAKPDVDPPELEPEPSAGAVIFDRRGRVVLEDLKAVAPSPKLRSTVLAYLRRQARLLGNADALSVPAFRRSPPLPARHRRLCARARFTHVASCGAPVGGGFLAVVDLVPVVPSPRARLRLTPRERDLAGLLVRGLSNREIGERLVLAENTVKWHLTHVLRKAEVPSRGAFVALVQANADAHPEF